MSKRDRLGLVAHGLTLFNVGLGLSFWAALWVVVGAKWNLVALFLAPGAFFLVLGLGYCTRVPTESRARPFAWLATAGFATFFAWSFYELTASEDHLFPLPSLYFAELGILFSFVYVQLLIRYLPEPAVARRGALRAWWAAAGISAAAVILQGFILTESDVEPFQDATFRRHIEPCNTRGLCQHDPESTHFGAGRRARRKR